MLETIREDVTRILSTAEFRFQQPQEMSLPELPSFLSGHIDALTGLNDAGGPRVPGSEAILAGLGSTMPAAAAAAGEDPYADLGLSRNAPCPCGSGAKYKHCHGAVA